MIYIAERESQKVVGDTSLFIMIGLSPQNAILNKLIKECDGSNYSKRTKLWEVPNSYLAKLLDDFCYLDDITLELINCQESIIINKKVDVSKFKTKPFDYQVEGIKFGLEHDRWLLLDVPGLGKTITALYIAQELKEHENLQHCLIICGLNTLKENWRKEVEKHTDLSCRILGAVTSRRGNTHIKGVAERIKQLNNPIEEFYVITNIETLRDDRVLEALLNGPNKFDMIVLDEAHVIKNPTSQQSENLMKLNAKYKLAMTGTLLLNNPLDAYVPLSWIGKERSTYTNFKNYYCMLGGEKHNILCGFKNIKHLKNTIESCSLRRTKDLLNLPPKTIINEYVEMSPEQELFYENIKQGIKEQVDKVKLTTNNILAMSSRFRQATACPSILTTEAIPSAKIERAKQLVEEITSSNEKVVIFSTFKETVYTLERELAEYKPLIATGDFDDLKISKAIDKFQSDPESKVFICTWQKCGTGITLTSACYEIFVDTPWTDGAYEQCQDRCYRIGTKKNVTIYHLITAKTIDERVLDILNTKGALADYIIDDKITQQGISILQRYIEDI